MADLKFPPPFIEAAHFTLGPRTAVDLVVLHSMEHPEKPGTARAVAWWFHDPERSPQASAHYALDEREAIQCVREADIAWGAKGANRNGIQLEHAGYAAQTADDWGDEYSMAVLHRSAGLCASICRAWSIPAQLVDAAGLLVHQRGITTHAEVSRAFKTPGGHTDPGPNFPLPWYVDRVRALLAEGTAA